MSAGTNKENTEPDNVNVGLIATITVVGAVLVLSIALALTALVRAQTAEFSNEIGAYGNLGAVKRLKAEQTAALEATPTWVDKDKGLVALPIDRAKVAVTAEIQKDPTRATAAAPAGATAAAAPAPAPEGTTAAAAPAVEKVGKEPAATEKTAQTRTPASQN
jgi:hypothetical protein